MRPLIPAVAALAAAVALARPDPPPAELPPDLALVPADAVGFVHVRAADLWKTDFPRFAPKIPGLDRATGFVLADPVRKEPVPFLAVRTAAPLDRDAVVTAHLPGARKVTAGGRVAFVSDEAGLGVLFPDDRHLVLGPARGFEVYLKHPAAKAGPLAHGLRLAAAGRPVVVGLNPSALPPAALGGLAGLKAEHLTAALDLGAEPRLEFAAGYRSADDAKAAEAAVTGAAEFVRKELARRKDGPAVPADDPAADLVGALTAVLATAGPDPGKHVRRDGATLAARVPLPKEPAAADAPAAVGTELLFPASRWMGAAARAKSLNNLKQIALAVHNYHDTHNKFPQDVVTKDGKPLLSWRVQILPYIEQENVFRQFKLDEPWNSENNKKAAAAVVPVFTSPNVTGRLVDADGFALTHYQGVAGPGTVFERGKGPQSLAHFTDGTSNTIMVVETAEAVPWAKPADLPYDPKGPLPKWGVPGSDVLLVVLGDGTTRGLNLRKVSDRTMRSALTHSGGEVLGSDW
ncbi:MAG: hypothetical protein C0501_03190 [Isosphaera sp.]|nr:hypothetical protein [Isosphaera sp.]